MQFSVKVEAREVLAAGVLVLGAEDRDMSFVLDGMEFTVSLIPAPTPLAVGFVRKSLKHMVVELRGEFPEFTAAWKLAALAQAGDRQIDLDLMVYSQSSNPQSVRQVSFTFTAHPGRDGQVQPQGAVSFL